MVTTVLGGSQAKQTPIATRLYIHSTGSETCVRSSFLGAAVRRPLVLRTATTLATSCRQSVTPTDLLPTSRTSPTTTTVAGSRVSTAPARPLTRGIRSEG